MLIAPACVCPTDRDVIKVPPKNERGITSNVCLSKLLYCWLVLISFSKMLGKVMLQWIPYFPDPVESKVPVLDKSIVKSSPQWTCWILWLSIIWTLVSSYTFLTLPGCEFCISSSYWGVKPSLPFVFRPQEKTSPWVDTATVWWVPQETYLNLIWSGR